MKKIVLTVVAAMALVAALALTGCQQAASSYTFGSGQVETKGKVVTVKLDGNPTTGYEWTYEKAGDALVYKSDSYTSSGKAADAGAGGVYTYTFEGAKAGTTKMTFTYARSWEQTDQDIVVEIEVTTDASGNVTSTQTKSSDGTGGSSKS